MRRSVVVVGDSALALLVARALDQDVARSAHVEVTYLSRDSAFVYSPHLSTILGKHHFPAKKNLFKHVRFKATQIKQINLRDRRVITAAGIYDYDCLLLDLTPTFISSDIDKITSQCQRLITEIQARLKTGRQLRARVTFAGQDVMSWQLAAALGADLVSHPSVVQRAISVQAEFDNQSALKAFLADNNVTSRKTVGMLAGLTVGAPSSILKSRLVRGALLDEGDNFILESTLNPEGHPDCIVIDQRGRKAGSVLRIDQTFALKIAANIERFLAGSRQLALEVPRSAGVLTGAKASLAWIGSMESRRLRSAAMAALDRRFYRRLIS